MNTSTAGAHTRARLAELRALRHERGATDPILIIAGIAITLILLVGGSFAVAGFMNNARDLNTKADLDRIATAQTKSVAASNGKPKSALLYVAGDILGPAAEAGTFGPIGWDGDDGPDFEVILSGGTEAVVIPAYVPDAAAEDGTGRKLIWVAYARSSTGTWFMKYSESSGTFDFGPIDNLQIPDNLLGQKFGDDVVTASSDGFETDIRSLADSLEQLGG